MNDEFVASLVLRLRPERSRPVLGPGNVMFADEAAGDGVLIDAVRCGNEEALRTVYERYGGLVFTIAIRLVGEAGLAQEVTQDVFVRCWERARAFDPTRGTLQAWLIGIARNRAIDVLRSRHARGQDRERELPAFEFVGEPASSGDGIGDDVALRLSLRAALDRLSAVQREAIELAIFGQLTQSEIADLLDVPLGTVKTRIRDGMAHLRSDLATGPRTQGIRHA